MEHFALWKDHEPACELTRDEFLLMHGLLSDACADAAVSDMPDVMERDRLNSLFDKFDAVLLRTK